MYRKINKGWLKHWDFELADLICIEIAFFIAYYIRHRELLASTVEWYVQLGFILLAIDIVVVCFGNNYKNIVQRSAASEFLAVIQHVTVVELIFVSYEFIMKETAILSRYVVLVSWGLSGIICFITRLCMKTLIRKRITSEGHQSKMLVITNRERVLNCMNQVLSKRIRDYRVTCIAMPKEDETDENESEETKP